jgi:hypothetical protein
MDAEKIVGGRVLDLCGSGQKRMSVLVNTLMSVLIP